MPIKDLTDVVRLPRLGKIHLGLPPSKEKNYPQKTDYFVLPKDHPDYPALVKAFGEKPKELHILIPVEDEEVWATQYYKAYTLTHGLVCKGDGETAVRMVDIKTKTFPGKDTATMAMLDMACTGKECPEYKAKKCRRVMNLRFMLPEIPGLGVWQIDTSSGNSIRNINSCAKMIKNAFKRISGVPLNLTFEPAQVNNPDDGKKQTVYVMFLRTKVTINQLAEATRKQVKDLMIEPPDLEAAFQVEVEEDIADLWPEGPELGGPTGQAIEAAKKAPVKETVKSEPVKSATTATATQAGTEGKEPDTKPKRDPNTLKDINAALKALKEDYNMQPKEVYANLNVKGVADITNSPAACYITVAGAKGAVFPAK